MRNLLFSVPYKQQSFALRVVLSFLSIGYRLGAFLSSFFRRSVKRVPLPVISVGSVIAGGSGKTTFVALLAEEIGRPLAILSHGYLGEKTGRVQGIEYGDEAFLLHKKLPFARVFAGKNRVANAKLAVLEDVELILLDSGMQVDYLYKDLEIGVVHYDNLWHHWHYLPRGLLRESPYGLKKCDAVVIHGVLREEEFTRAIDFLKKYTNGPFIGTNTFVINREEIQGKKVGAFTGIGHPDRFYRMVEEVGGEIVYKETLADHAALEKSERFIEEALQHGAEGIVCTEKDFIKLPPLKNVFPLKIRSEILFGREVFTSLLDRIETLILKGHETRRFSP